MLTYAGDEGYNEAGAQYEAKLPGIQKKFMNAGEARGVKNTHPTSYSRGFLAGLDAPAVAAEDPRRLNIVVPQVKLSAHLQALIAQPTVVPAGSAGDGEGSREEEQEGDEENRQEEEVEEENTEHQKDGSPTVVFDVDV